METLTSTSIFTFNAKGERDDSGIIFYGFEADRLSQGIAVHGESVSLSDYGLKFEGHHLISTPKEEHIIAKAVELKEKICSKDPHHPYEILEIKPQPNSEGVLAW